MSVEHCNDYNNFVINFEIGKCLYSNFIFLYKSGFVCFEAPGFPQDLRNSWSISGKTITEIPIGLMLNL